MTIQEQENRQGIKISCLHPILFFYRLMDSISCKSVTGPVNTETGNKGKMI